MQMQEIHVKRYGQPAAGYVGTISPADGSWILFVAAEGLPDLYRRVARRDSEGQVDHDYEPAGTAQAS